MQITRKTVLKGTVAVLGAILVGAVGSGVWEGLLGPALRALRNWILESISLVFIGFKNSVYAEIARDHPSAVSMASHFLLVALLLLICAAYISHVAGSIREVESKLKGVARQFEEIVQGKPQEQRTPDQIDAEIKRMSRGIEGMRKLLYAVSGLTAFFLAMNIVNFSRLSYIDSALVHYHQVLRIVSPYLKPDEKLAVESQFAQIRTRQQYAEVIERLAAVAKTHGHSVPSFDPW